MRLPILSILILLINFYRLNAQTEEVFTIVEQQPSFPGGQDSLNAFIKQNMVYPESAIKDSIKGAVYINFVVSKDSTLNGIKILRGLSSDCDREALRIVQKMPKWNPGMQRGQPVNVSFNLPIKFVLNNKDKKGR